MNKQEQSVMDEFVNRHNGVNEFGAAYFEINGIEFTGEQFNQRALELGWVSGFKWGVEYPTNGKKPGLPDDVLVKVLDCGSWNKSNVTCGEWNYKDKWHTKFRIVDERYKPKEPELQTKNTKDLPDVIFAVSDAISVAVDAGAMPAARELQKINRDLLAKDPVVGIGQPEPQTNPDNSWYERGECPPAGTYCQVKQRDTFINCYVVGNDDNGATVYRIDGYYGAKMNQSLFRPIKSEREKFVESALGIYVTTSATTFEDFSHKLYDAGFRAPG